MPVKSESMAGGRGAMFLHAHFLIHNLVFSTPLDKLLSVSYADPRRSLPWAVASRSHLLLSGFLQACVRLRRLFGCEEFHIMLARVFVQV